MNMHYIETYLFPPLELTENSLKALMHVVKLRGGKKNNH